ncbi:hypothetical protein FHT85_004241 [Rhizobium sp. BK312]|uniref:hypothetical protein n=1 Tax=Rhizobium sp. BK312 TaxID=2587080 RepID=UPI0013AF5797|nr:hypothetical protein [Rhizobium sp. BK312]MBB3427240.1 hypothetical protein [Rhizobium sp. BK312]
MSDMRKFRSKERSGGVCHWLNCNEFDSTPQQQKAVAAYLSADLEFPMPMASWRDA